MANFKSVENRKGCRASPVCVGLTFSALLVSTLVVAVAAAASEGPPIPAGDPTIWQMKRWSPYVAGIGIGVLSWLVFLLSDNTLGASGSYAKTAGMLEKILDLSSGSASPFWDTVRARSPGPSVRAPWMPSWAVLWACFLARRYTRSSMIGWKEGFYTSVNSAKLPCPNCSVSTRGR